MEPLITIDKVNNKINYLHFNDKIYKLTSCSDFLLKIITDKNYDLIYWLEKNNILYYDIKTHTENPIKNYYLNLYNNINYCDTFYDSKNTKYLNVILNNNIPYNVIKYIFGNCFTNFRALSFFPSILSKLA